jgi:eukaryotic-like serine/threonine-protein kinase
MSAEVPGQMMGPGPELAQLREELAPDLEVLRIIGTGRAGRVYLARERALDRLVAVKVLASGLARDVTARTRFEREARAAAALDHPNAVAVHRTGTLSSGVPYLVMQYVRGPNLEDRLAAEGPLPPHEARRVLAQVAAALGAAHKRGFVHRDVRPGNILCDLDEGRVLVSDFGLAGILPFSQRTDPGITRPGQILGALTYLSPEQLRGEPATEGTDVYSIGVLGYELLTGRSPWPVRPGVGGAMPDFDARPIPLASLRPDVDPELAGLLERALARDPARRPGAGYLAEALSSGPATGASGPSPADTVDLLNVLLKRRVPQIVAVTGVLGLAVLGFFDMLADRDVVPEVAFRLALATVACLLGASVIVAWFHGERGEQRVTALEVLLLVVVGAVWIALGFMILAG